MDGDNKTALESGTRLRDLVWLRPDVRRWPRAVYLTALGISSILLYSFGITARYPLSAGLQQPGAFWAALSGFSPWAGLRHAAVYCALVLCYAAAVHLALRVYVPRPAKAAQWWIALIVGVWLVCSLVLLGAYPGESLDIFDYLFRGRLLAELGESPLAVVPASFANQPFYSYIQWPQHVDTYGPLWEYASGAVAAIVGALSTHAPGGSTESLTQYIVGYRLLAISITGLCGVLIYSIVRRHSPQHVAPALLAWFWNPVLVTSTALGAHNDMLMLLAILAAMALVQRRRWVWSLLALIAAAHVKLTAVLLLPVIALWIVRRAGWRHSLLVASGAVALAVPLSWLAYLPLGGWATLSRMLAERGRLLSNSLAYLFYWLLQRVAGWSEFDAWKATTLGATLLFFVVAAALLLRFWSSAALDDDQILWDAGSTLMLAFLAIGSFWFWHWYLLWVLVLAVLRPASRFTRLVLPGCCLLVLWLQLATDFLLAPH